MASTSHAATAKIYQFPVKPRSTVASYGNARAAVAELRGPSLARMEFGSGWYHEAAMQEEAQAQKREGH